MSYPAAMNAIEQARKDVVEYVKHAPEVNTQWIRELSAQWKCQSVYMGASLVIYAPGSVARFSVNLEDMEVREIVKH